PEEYAELAGQLISNAYVNGETIRIDGSIRMAPR
ncbi:MAG: 3-hydroxyacyl-CoA dehydrogenase, partial [Rhizorhabdus sp.]